jgi:hypothetical protein
MGERSGGKGGHGPPRVRSEIEIESSSRATGVWAMEDIVTFAEDVPKRPFKSLNGFGHYHEIYIMDGGRWRIKSILLSRIKQDII